MLVRASGPARASYAHGGNVGAAATGGGQGGPTLVGEAGPALVNLPYGSSVMTNSNFNSMVAGGFGAPVGGSGGAVQVKFSGDTDSAFATYFMRLVRIGKIQIKAQAVKKFRSADVAVRPAPRASIVRGARMRPTRCQGASDL